MRKVHTGGMRRWFLLPLLCAGAVSVPLLPGCSWLPWEHRPSSPLVGSWVNRVGAIWMIKADGTFDVDLKRDGKRDAWGKYMVDGDKVTIVSTGGIMPKDCQGEGIYHFRRSGPELIFTLVRDSCRLRKRNVLLGWRLKR